MNHQTTWRRFETATANQERPVAPTPEPYSPKLSQRDDHEGLVAVEMQDYVWRYVLGRLRLAAEQVREMHPAEREVHDLTAAGVEQVADALAARLPDADDSEKMDWHTITVGERARRAIREGLANHRFEAHNNDDIETPRAHEWAWGSLRVAENDAEPGEVPDGRRV
jgi:hypothetical protein